MRSVGVEVATRPQAENERRFARFEARDFALKSVCQRQFSCGRAVNNQRVAPEFAHLAAQPLYSISDQEGFCRAGSDGLLRHGLKDTPIGE